MVVVKSPQLRTWLLQDALARNFLRRVVDCLLSISFGLRQPPNETDGHDLHVCHQEHVHAHGTVLKSQGKDI